MAITVDYVILPHLRKADGTNFIRLRITHKRKSKYIKTNIAVSSEHLTRSGNLKHQGKIDLATDEVRKYRKVVDAMPTSSSDAMDVAEVLRYVTAKLAEEEEMRLNFASYGMQLAEKKKPGTAHNDRVALRSLVRYFGYEPDISEITVRTMRAFEEFIKTEAKHAHSPKTHQSKEVKGKKSERSVIKYTGIVRAIYKEARREFNDPDLDIMRLPVDIFEYYKVPRQKPSAHRDIPAEWVQMMIDQRTGLAGRERLGVDVFLLSFGLMGMNAADMYECAEKIRDGVVHYFRAKTTDRRDDGAEMYVRVEDCLKPLFEAYKGRVRLFDFHTRYASKAGFILAVNSGLRQWIERNKLKDFTFYSARHTWATLGASKQVGIDYALVTEGLCHVDNARKMDNVYIRKDWERVWDANAKVLSLLKWK
jgi:integrase